MTKFGWIIVDLAWVVWFVYMCYENLSKKRYTRAVLSGVMVGVFFVMLILWVLKGAI